MPARDVAANVLAALASLAAIGVIVAGLQTGRGDGLGHVMVSGISFVVCLGAWAAAGTAALLTKSRATLAVAGAAAVATALGLVLAAT